MPNESIQPALPTYQTSATVTHHWPVPTRPFGSPARCLVTLALAALLVTAGCDSNEPDACADVPVVSLEELLSQNNRALHDERLTASKRIFVGRDSFGVVLDANFSGTIETRSDGRCPATTVVHTGSGQGTHLGSISVEQSHCVDPETPSVVTDGQFRYEGADGALISGTYYGTLASPTDGAPTIDASIQITDGAFECTPPDPEQGRGSFSGTVESSGDFTYHLEGWLFHHEEE